MKQVLTNTCNSFENLESTFPKRVVPVQKRKNKWRWILHIWISLCTKFHLKQTNLNFWTKFAQKGCLWTKTKKHLTSLSDSAYSSYTWSQISAYTNNFDFSRPNLENIRLYTKYQLVLAIFFRSKSIQKRYFSYKAETRNVTIKFSMFEIV